MFVLQLVNCDLGTPKTYIERNYYNVWQTQADL